MYTDLFAHPDTGSVYILCTIFALTFCLNAFSIRLPILEIIKVSGKDIVFLPHSK